MHSRIPWWSLAVRLAALNGAAASRCSHRPGSGTAYVSSSTTEFTSSSTIPSSTDLAVSISSSSSGSGVPTSTTLSESSVTATASSTSSSASSSSGTTSVTDSATESATTTINTTSSLTESTTPTPTATPPPPTLPESFNMIRLDPTSGQETSGVSNPFPPTLYLGDVSSQWIPLHLDIPSGRVLSDGKYLCVAYSLESDQVAYVNLCDGTEDQKRPAQCTATSTTSVSCSVPVCHLENDASGSRSLVCNSDSVPPWNTWYSYNGFGTSLVLGPSEYTGGLSKDRLSKLAYTLKATA